MCAAEGGRFLQKGMNFRPKAKNSVLLMSRRPDAMYADSIQEEGRVLIYQGHDARPTPGGPDPKGIDQPLVNPDGRPTDNGKFFEAAMAARDGAPPIRVHVYEKLMTGVWAFNGAFLLVDAWIDGEGQRKVCRFKLALVDEGSNTRVPAPSRLIPSNVKAEVWKRDQGRCVLCGSSDNLHFDHMIPFSKGGTSFKAENIQILCARHNLAKRDKIE